MKIAGRTGACATLLPVRILVVEDDPSIAQPLVSGLARQGCEPQLVTTGRGALDSAGGADLILLDLGLPDLDGTEVCRRLRSVTTVPIIVVSARSEEVDRVLLLETGADDYVVKPFGLRELIARIRAVTRRAGGAAAPQDLVVGPLVVGLRTPGGRGEAGLVELPRREFAPLPPPAPPPAPAPPRRDILEEVWDPNWYGSAKTLDVHVASLRRKLGHPEWIQAVRGVGFRLVVPGGDPHEVGGRGTGPADA